MTAAVPTDKARVVTYVDHEVKQALNQLAEADMRSLSNLVEKVLKEFVESQKKKS